VTPAPLAGAGANSTDQTRVALNIAYNSSYLKQECNTFVTATPKVVRQMQLPSLVTELLGYAGDEAKFLALGGDGVEEHQAVARL
jgi:ectoine hydroxylase-related dioxygenase (phytanoyl-CoA dioxygenase family)